MKPETLARLKEARLAAKLTQADVAEHLGVKNNTISNYEKGVTEPDIDTFVGMCALYGLDFAEILKEAYSFSIDTEEMILSRPEKAHIKKYRSLDGYGKDIVDTVLNKEHTRCLEQAQRAAELAEDSASYASTRFIAFPDLPVSAGTGICLTGDRSEMIEIPLTAQSARADFILRVSGDSMEPDYHTGDVILVQSQPAVEPGELGIFVLNGDGYFKRFGVDRLQSLNPSYPDIVIGEGDSLRCLGRVLGKVE